jgi:hypothetical protein
MGAASPVSSCRGLLAPRVEGDTEAMTATRRLAAAAVVLPLLLGLAAVVPAPPAGAAGRPARPPVGTDVDYQLGGAVRAPGRVGIVVRDRRAAPAPGRYNVCYVNGFQTQPDQRRFWKKRPRLLLHRGGRPVVDSAWGEWLLDIRTRAKRTRIASIIGRWIDRCAADGYDAVELDNLDSFSRSHRLIRPRHARAHARLLVRRAHRAGLAAAQKNWAELDGRRLGYDFAIAEECGRYGECGRYVARYGRRVLVVEYRRVDFARSCERFGRRLAIVLRDRALRPHGRRSWC